MENKKVKTLIIISPGFPANEEDTTCLTYIQVFVKALKQASPSLNIIVLAIRYPFFSKTYVWHGVKAISFGSENRGKLVRLLANFKVLLVLKKLNKEVEIVGVLSFWFDISAFIASIFSRLYKLKCLSWLLGQDAKIGNKYVKLIKPRGEQLIAISDFICQEFEMNYAIKPQHIIPLGIDDSLFSEIELSRDIDILGVGSLIPLKQYHLFLGAIKQLIIPFPNLKAVLCGDGIEMEMLKAKLTTLKLENHVSLVGSLAHAEILNLMQKAKVLMHTSNYEGMGVVNLEALCAGAKVVSFVKPMQIPIKNWYHASSLEEMIAIVTDILSDKYPIYEKVLPYSAAANSKAVLAAFGIEG